MSNAPSVAGRRCSGKVTMCSFREARERLAPKQPATNPVFFSEMGSVHRLNVDRLVHERAQDIVGLAFGHDAFFA